MLIFGEIAMVRKRVGAYVKFGRKAIGTSEVEIALPLASLSVNRVGTSAGEIARYQFINGSISVCFVWESGSLVSDALSALS